MVWIVAFTGVSIELLVVEGLGVERIGARGDNGLFCGLGTATLDTGRRSCNTLVYPTDQLVTTVPKPNSSPHHNVD
jgi:hypothetical protein